MKKLVCPACKAEKSRKQFKRLATLTQTKAWLRNPLASKRMTYFGRECNECHKQVKRNPSDLTPEELRKRLVNEGVNPTLIEARVAKRKAQGFKKKSKSASRTMREVWQARKLNNKER